jgi:hypothetical protein
MCAFFQEANRTTQILITLGRPSHFRPLYCRSSGDSDWFVVGPIWNFHLRLSLIMES